MIVSTQKTIFLFFPKIGNFTSFSGRGPSTTGDTLFGTFRKSVKNHLSRVCQFCFEKRTSKSHFFEKCGSELVKTFKNGVFKMAIGLKSALLRNHDFGK